MKVSWLLLDESELLSFDHQFHHRICNFGRLTSPALFPQKMATIVTLLMPNTKNLLSQNSFGC